MANGDLVPVQGPDGKKYNFPSGTTKEMAVSYFKKKGIGVPSATLPKTPKPEGTSQPQTGPLTYGQQISQGLDSLQAKLTGARPRWDDPSKILQDPHWYGASARYLGGEAVGAGKAGAGLAIGSAKLVHDLASMLDPQENRIRGIFTPQGTGTQFGHDIGDIGKGTWDLLRHFPDALNDPESTGSKVMNAAMLVDGGIKMARETAPVLKANASDALSWANQASKRTMKSLFQQRALEDQYVHANGVKQAKAIVDSVKDASREVRVHTDNLAKIDKNVPAGVIDASKEAASVEQHFQDVVQTPQKYAPSLSALISEAKKTSPGLWTFEKAKQFRTLIGRAMPDAVGPQRAVLTKEYASLTSKLGETAKQYGLEDSWNQYNKLESSISKSFPIIDKAQKILSINGAGSEMAQALKDDAPRKELGKSLSQYGLDAKKMEIFAKRASKIMRERKEFNASIFRYAYRMRPGMILGLPALMIGREIGGWLGGLGASAAVGLTTSYLAHAARAWRLSPEIAEEILTSRKWPAKLTPPSGSFPQTTEPSSQTPQPKAPQPPGVSPSAESAKKKAPPVKATPPPSAPPVQPRGMEEIGKHGFADPLATEALKPKSVKKAGIVTKVPEGQHGTGKIAEQAKARERVAKGRAEHGVQYASGGGQEISGGGAAEAAQQAKEAEAAQRRAQASPVSMEHIGIPEAEEILKAAKNKDVIADFKALLKMRRNQEINDAGYIDGLRYLALEELESRTSGETSPEE